MILKGNQRGGGQQLAAHLQNSFDNERVEIAEVRGTVAQDLSGAFAEWAAEARGTKCTKFLYSLSLNPYQPNGRLTREQYVDLLERTERSLKLVGQPRAVVFHEKRDKDGVLREHCHAVWSRIDTDKMRAVQMGHDRLKLRTVAQEFARDHGLELPDGMKPGNSRDSRKERYNKRAAQENLGEKQQQERTGITKAERRADIASCWTGTANGAAFVHALETKGYFLARGDARDYVVIDAYGEIHSLSRQLSGVTKKKELTDRLADYPPDQQRDVESARAYAREKLQERQKAQETTGAKATEGNKPDPSRAEDVFGIEKRIAALHPRQQQRRAELDKHRLDLHARQFRERAALRDMQADHHAEVAAERQGKQPKGLAGFLTRITGIGRFVAWAQVKADRKREAAHRHETDALLRHHSRELKEMERHYDALDRLEKRENRAAANAALREGYRKLRTRSFELKPEFDKALTRTEPAGTSGSGSKTPTLFNRLASGIGLTKGDLQAAFERATAGKTVRKEDTDTAGHAPVDAEKWNALVSFATNSAAGSRVPAPTGTGSGDPRLEVWTHAALPLGLPDIREFRVTLPYLQIGGPDFPANFRRQLIPPTVVYSPQFGIRNQFHVFLRCCGSNREPFMPHGRQTFGRTQRPNTGRAHARKGAGRACGHEYDGMRPWLFERLCGSRHGRESALLISSAEIDAKETPHGTHNTRSNRLSKSTANGCSANPTW